MDVYHLPCGVHGHRPLAKVTPGPAVYGSLDLQLRGVPMRAGIHAWRGVREGVDGV